MYLIDTNVISEARKGARANAGVRAFFDRVTSESIDCYLSVVTLGELQRGVELIRHRGDHPQAAQLEAWLDSILTEYADNLLDFEREAARLWGSLRAPRHEHAIDKQLAATALVHDLTLVTRNTADFAATGVRLLNPFE